MRNLFSDFLFEKKKVSVQLPFCERNEKLSKKFIAKLNSLTDKKYSVHVMWQTRKIESIFNQEQKHPSILCYIYDGNCSCGKPMLVKQCAMTKLKPQNTTTSNNTIPINSVGESFTRTEFSHKHKILEGLFTERKIPSLNKQVNC